ncbi:MAG: isochorismate synthase [bacterium]
MQEIKACAEKSIDEIFEKIVQNQFSTITNITKDKIWRIEIPIERVDPIQWLYHQPFKEKIYWKDRHGHIEIVGCGQAKTISGDRCIDYPALFDTLQGSLAVSDKDVRYFGGFMFDQTQSPDADWAPFAAYRFFVPEFEMISEGDGQRLAFNFLLSEDEDMEHQLLSLRQRLSKLLPARQVDFNHLPCVLSRKDIPDWSGWKGNVQKALELFDQGVLKKVVLARKSMLTFDEELDPVKLLHLLSANNFQTFHFYFQLDRNYAFLGITPERLYKRNGRDVFSEAIAGTRPRGQSEEEDSRLGHELLESDKDLREHRWVSDIMESSLQPLCRSIDVLEKETLLKLGHVQHLYTCFRCLLKERVGDGEILAGLHPTPAVGGFPRENSLLKITELEPFQRGWYAGPVGWIGKDSSEFVVAIRSALAKEKTLSLFAGSGIVQGSQPETEWEENENKILNFTRLFCTRDH